MYWFTVIGLVWGSVLGPLAPVGTLSLELENSALQVGTLNLELEDSPRGGVGTLFLELEESAQRMGSLELELEDSSRGTEPSAGSLSLELE